MTDRSKVFGEITAESFPILNAIENPTVSQIIGATASGVVLVGAIITIALLTRFRLWRPLFRDWLFSVDHKKIGIMYIILAFVMLARGIAEGAIMRAQQAAGLNGGFLAPEHFAELFSTHGTIMIFFVAMPFVTGFINYIVPLQLGARDMAFPVMNQISLGLTAAGAALVMISLVIGEFSTGGWTAYPPYTGKVFSPGVGPDYWIWSVAIAGIGSTLSGINFAVTIYKKRAPGMTFMRMPLFSWTALSIAIIMIFAMPPLTVATLMLAADRYLDFHFFTNDLGGNIMNYANLFWLFGHPEVYLLVLPAYGIYSEVISTYSTKRLYGYSSLVYATIGIAVLSFTVWLHHFFTMGQDANVNAAFGIATMFIAIPTGVKVYDWLATMFRGRIRLRTPMVYASAFLVLFVIGGLTGIILANPTVDYQVHNSVFLVAHFHNVLIPGVLFGMLAAYHYWFPKAFGFRLHEGLGIASALLWAIGFSVTFFPLYVLGLMGMPRRSSSYTDPTFEPLTLVSALGAMILLLAFSTLVVQLVVSLRRRDELSVPVGDPWNGQTLEWSISSPPPHYNFAVLPTVNDRDAFWFEKSVDTAYSAPNRYEDIEVPKDTPLGLILAALATTFGFALVFQIVWLIVCAGFVMIGIVIADSFRLDKTRIIPASDVEAEHKTWLALVATTKAIRRDRETTSDNQGLAVWEVEERWDPVLLNDDKGSKKARS